MEFTDAMLLVAGMLVSVVCLSWLVVSSSESLDASAIDRARRREPPALSRPTPEAASEPQDSAP